MNILLLRGFNSYFNRIVKKYSTVDDYKANSSSYLELSNMNFNTNDGVNTELIIGSPTQLENNKPLAWEDIGSPDYLICIDPADSSIKYRWFVLECVRTRNGQYKISLKRDTVADNLEDILNSTCFIEKGYVDKEDSAIYNKEDMTFNQIKDNEYLLMDETQTPWIVGYVAKDKSQNGAVNDVEFTDAPITNIEATASKVSEEYATFDEFWNAHKDIMGEFGVLNYAEYSVQLDVAYGNLFTLYDVGITCTIDNNGRITWQESGFNNNSYLHGLTVGTTPTLNDVWVWKNWTYDGRQQISESLLGTLKPYLPQLLQFIANRENISIVSQDSDKIKQLVSYTKARPGIKVGNKYYKAIDEFDESVNASTLVDNPTVNGDMSNLMLEHLNKQPAGKIGHDTISGPIGPETFKFNVSYNKHKLGFMQIYETCTAHVPAAAPLLQDAPYHMFAIPYSDDLTLFSGDQIHCSRTKKSVAIAAAQAIATKAGAGAVYDVQILPYCPIRQCIKTTYKKDGTYELSSGGTYDTKHVIIPKPGSGVQIIKRLILNHDYYLNRSYNGEFTITSNSIIKVMYDNSFTSATTVYEVKKLEINTTGIKLYTNIEDETPILTIDYNTYSSGDKVLTVYLTDSYTSSMDANDYVYQFGDIVINKGDSFYTTVDIGKVVSSDITVDLDGSSQVVNTILWANTSKFTFDLYLANHLLLQAAETGSGTTYKVHSISQDVIDNLSFGFNAMNVKVKSQTELVRLVSPNYASFFDINVQYNKGINYFNIDCFYKPYQPYIHVNPDFNGLYGKDFDDVRGLICGGDFSIALTNDAWSTYQLNNKNYQAIFDRNMQSLELNNNIQKINDVASAIAGTFQGATGGAMSGAVVGGPWGAAIGAGVGTIASAVGGAADVQNNELLRNEAMSNQRDQFGYQLKNIQALPQGLMKTSSLNNNNKLYPFLEHYTSTAEEKHALENKITYNGMTIMRIGTPSEFIQEESGTYVKGRLIRTAIQDDNHLISDINAELNQGVYL